MSMVTGVQEVHLTVKEKIAVLKLLNECDEAKFALLEKNRIGPEFESDGREIR